MLKRKDGSGSDGILAKKVPVELHAIIHYAWQFTDNYVDSGDTLGFGFSGLLQGYGQDTLSDAELVQSIETSPLSLTGQRIYSVQL